MSGQNTKNSHLLTLFAVAILLIIAIWAFLRPTPAEQKQTVNPQNQNYDNIHKVDSAAPAGKEPQTPAAEQKPFLKDIIRARRTWDPSFKSWYGQQAPQFTMTDIYGKEHKLSDYRGKNVILIFWATWCGPCRIELPHLIALRDSIGPDKLAMLAISNENSSLLRTFAKKVKINYTVISHPTRSLPSPFSRVTSIPSSFFITPEGKIKLATEGMISLGETRAILQAR